MLLIPLLCSLYVRVSIDSVGLVRMCLPSSTVMPLPIHPRNEYNYFLLFTDNIGFARQCLVINPLPVSHRKEAAAYHHLNAGILALNVGHNFTSPVRRNRIGHHTAKSSGRSEISFSRFPWTSVSKVSAASSDPTSFTARISS